MPTRGLISYSELAAECGVSDRAVGKFVRRNHLPNVRLPHSSAGRALARREADVVREYYAARALQLASA